MVKHSILQNPVNFHTILLPHISANDVTSIQIECTIGKTRTNMILASIYLLGRSTKDLVHKIVDNAAKLDIHLIIGCDSNAHISEAPLRTASIASLNILFSKKKTIRHHLV